jgi:hypothetical protein
VPEVYDPTGEKLALMLGQTLAEAKVPLPRGADAAYGASGVYDYRHPDRFGAIRLQSNPSREIGLDSNYAPFRESYAYEPVPGN